VKPIRVALFAPGNNARVMMKALGSGADAVILDLEDSVPLAAKAEARQCVAEVIDGKAANDPYDAGPAIFVRVNSTSTGLLDDDLAVITRPGLDAVVMPKVETVQEIRHADETISRRGGEGGADIELILMFESALGVYRCFDLLRASPRVAASCLGGARDGDLQSDLGCDWSIDGIELMYARSKVLLETRAAGSDLKPLDGVFSDLIDREGLLKDSRLSARLGYVGRTVIHPNQIAPVREAYAVPEAQVAYYRKVIGEFEAAEAAGKGAISVDGKLVDYAMYHRARRVLEMAALDEAAAARMKARDADQRNKS